MYLNVNNKKNPGCFPAENPIDPSNPEEIADEFGISIDVGSSSSHYTVAWNANGDATAEVSISLEETWGAAEVIGTGAMISRPIKVATNSMESPGSLQY